MASQIYRTIIFDVDGTLVNSNDAHARSWVEALAEQGYEVSFSAVRQRIGMGGDNLLPELIHQDKNSPAGKKASTRRKEIFWTQYLPTIQPFPEVPELFLRAKGAGLKTAIASSSEQDELEALLRIAGVQGLADTVISSSNAQKSKPDAAPVRIALEKSHTAPGQAIMVGDTPYDIESAHKVDVNTIAVRCGGFSDKDLKDAVAIYDAPANLLFHFEQCFLGLKR